MLEAKNISYAHKDFKILKDVSFSAYSGKMISIVGPNGAGKSTLLSALSSELGSFSTILFKEKSFDEWNTGELSKHKAKFSQQYNTDIPLLVEDVTLMGRYPYFDNNPSENDFRAIEAAMDQTDVLHLRKRDYNTLSGGEKQRVHLARVLAQLDNNVTNKLIFLDEPLNNLDIYHQYRILESVKKFTQNGNTAVLVLHDLNLTARFSDEVFMMKNGNIVVNDIPTKVFTKEIISEVYNFPCTIFENPVDKKPMIFFGSETH